MRTIIKHLEAWGLSIFALVCACTSDPMPADPGVVDYARVQQIFDSRCAGSACHIGASDPSLYGGELHLSAMQAAPCLLNVSSSQDPQRVRVKPSDPDASYLMCKIDPACDAIIGSRMPVGDPLSSDDVAVLRAWILQGAKGGATGACGAPPTGGNDLTSPSFAGATVATSAPNSVRVQWAAATDNTTAQAEIVYLLYQATASGGQNLATPSRTSTPGVTSYSVGQLAINTTYYFVVRARDQAGNIDSNRVEVSAIRSFI
jgi:hypothetical protein